MTTLSGPAERLTIYLGESDRHHHVAMHAEIIHRAHAGGMGPVDDLRVRGHVMMAVRLAEIDGEAFGRSGEGGHGVVLCSGSGWVSGWVSNSESRSVLR